MPGRPNSALTLDILSSLISYTVAKLSGALALSEAWEAPPDLGAIVCLLLLLVCLLF